jgi:cytochrome c
MSGLEVNKILASIFVAFIVIGLISILGDTIINGKNNEQVKNAYYIDITEMKTSNAIANTENEEISEQISLFLTSASFEKGKKLFKKCSACHSYKKGSANKVGPNLWNIINRPKASIQDFTYSKALAEFSGNWGYEELNQFLFKPKEYIPGTKMNFSGLKKEEDRADLLLFLREQADIPADLP